MSKNIILLFCLGLFAVGCGSKDKDTQDVIAPHTGDPVVEETEKAVSPTHPAYNKAVEISEPVAAIETEERKKEDLALEKIYYVHASQLNVRSSREITQNILGRLELDDQVIVVDYESVEDDDFVEIKIVSSNREMKASEKYYVAYQYLGEKRLPREIKQKREKKSKYFVIQNIASKKIRVYERSPSKKHQLVFEESMIPGKNTDKLRTLLGRFKISAWHKFYQDYKKRYAPWYKKGMIDPPPAGAPLSEWKKAKYMEEGRDQPVRGPFGWYTAHLAPDAGGQWMHGTIGRGKDSNRFIEGVGYNRWGSTGCSRLNNEAITYLRDLLPTGTPVFKIYAKEDASDLSRVSLYDELQPLSTTERPAEHALPFNYVLTKSPTGKSGVKDLTMDRMYANNVIEFGTYKVDATPTVVQYYPKGLVTDYFNKKANYGNTYNLKDNELKGFFLVDQGVLKDYQHPSSLEVRGYKQMPIPDYIQID
ncbi:MAG: hypothetical protein CME64_00060 [Halobacteriovoraceae bacterium]|nr:hypothetical protein [Halobacteriovoraceae bacterium]|tara:strand:+ start:10368 stop:11801 length:1434 start_codon:yes stop_codon:yes gene_type:complete